VFIQPWLASPTDKRRDQVLYYQYKHDRARRTLRGTDQHFIKAERTVAGQAPAKPNCLSNSPAAGARLTGPGGLLRMETARASTSTRPCQHVTCGRRASRPPRAQSGPCSLADLGRPSCSSEPGHVFVDLARLE
jgi:hypothetical protein